MMGVGCLAGIGFTMSLFIGTLAFDTPAQIDAVRVGVIAGSVISTDSGPGDLVAGFEKTGVLKLLQSAVLDLFCQRWFSSCCQ